eukprot:11223316-Lingulodinium_polyedra.AAC.1
MSGTIAVMPVYGRGDIKDDGINDDDGETCSDKATLLRRCHDTSRAASRKVLVLKVMGRTPGLASACAGQCDGKKEKTVK